MTRMHTIELARVRGLTFLYLAGRPYAVVPHVSAKSCALSALQRLQSRVKRESLLCQKKVLWVYLPIRQDDRILALETPEMSAEIQVMVSTLMRSPGRSPPILILLAC